MTNPTVTQVRFTPAPVAEAAQGMLGYVALVLDGAVELRGLALRRTARGELRLSFPERRGRGGRRHAVVRPMSTEVRTAIEHAVLDALADVLAVTEPGALASLLARVRRRGDQRPNTGSTVLPEPEPDDPSGITPNPGARS